MNFDFNSVELHNIAGAEPCLCMDGVVLHRFPSAIRNLTLSRSPVNCELRFVCQAPEFQVYLGFISPDNCNIGPSVRVFKGNYEYELPLSFRLIPGRFMTLRLKNETMLDRMKPELHREAGFAPHVWRIMFDEHETIVFGGIDSSGYEVRKPLPEEKPRLKYLSIGGSVTQFGLDSYPSVAARRLRLDHWNFGMAGCCRMPQEYVDYIVSRDNFDIVTFMYGMNMLSAPLKEYRDNLCYFLKRITEKRPERPVIALPTYSCNLDRLIEPEQDPCYRTYCEIGKIMRAEVEKYKEKANIHLIEGNTLMDDMYAIKTDGLHLGVYGEVLYGINLAESMHKLLA